jgi:hypothetical protein
LQMIKFILLSPNLNLFNLNWNHIVYNTHLDFVTIWINFWFFISRKSSIVSKKIGTYINFHIKPNFAHLKIS